MGWLDGFSVKKNDENPKTENGNTYNYEVTDNTTGDTEYLTEKGMDAVKKWMDK